MVEINLGSITIEVEQKNIKHIHLTVHPPLGKVRITAPLRFDLDTIRLFAVSKLGWIKKQQEKLMAQERETQREFITRESHYFLGKRYLLEIVETNQKAGVKLMHNTLVLQVRSSSNTEQRQTILQEWQREQLKILVCKYIDKWEPIMQVKVISFGIKKMKTKWGTCSIEAQRIWLNLELAKKPLEYIEYIVVHEMVHLLERNHNEIFIAYMDKFLPQWQHYREELNRLPISHLEWKE